MKPMTPVMSAKIAMTIFEIMTFSSTASTMVTMVTIEPLLTAVLVVDDGAPPGAVVVAAGALHRQPHLRLDLRIVTRDT